MRGWAALLISMIVVLLNLSTTGSASPSASGFAGESLEVCFRPAVPGDDPAALIRQPHRFDCHTPQSKFGAGDFWILSQPITAGSLQSDPLNARIGSVWQRSLSLHVLYADGHVATFRDDNRGLSRRIQLGAIIEHRLPPRAAPVERLLWKSEGAANVRGILLGAYLATSTQSHRSNMGMALVYGAFGGLALALLIYNLALWAALRHRFQLAYCLMVAMLMGYAFTSSGALVWVLPDIANNDRLRLNFLFLGLAAASALWFARAFFEEHVFGRRLRIAVRWMIGILTATAIAYAVLAPVAIGFFDPFYSWVFLTVVGIVAAVMWSAWRGRSNYLWIFAIAWAAPIVAASLRVLANLHIIEWNFWVDNSTILSMAAEALISSVAIAYRIRLLSVERDQAVAAETVARRLADTDPLTGLRNRRSFLNNAIGRTGEQSLLLLDLDHFKQVNETLGHDGGDEVLRVVARTLRAFAPPGAIVARIGGEEFAVVSHPSQRLDGEALLGRLRATRMPFDLRVTASIGTAKGPLTTERDWKTLYRAADAALFAAKSAGRDRVRAAPLAA